jgi:hypothetical protein
MEAPTSHFQPRGKRRKKRKRKDEEEENEPPIPNFWIRPSLF